MIVRSIDRPDLMGCADLYADVFASAPWLEPWTARAALDRLAHFYESKGFAGILAEHDGLVGFALGNTEPYHSGSIYYLREMCVASNHQSQGVGRQVYDALENVLYARGVKSIYLATARTIPAARFYMNSGFECLDEMGFYERRGPKSCLFARGAALEHAAQSKRDTLWLTRTNSSLF